MFYLGVDLVNMVNVVVIYVVSEGDMSVIIRYFEFVKDKIFMG